MMLTQTPNPAYSRRLYFQGYDHTEIYYDNHYHDKLYLGSILLWEKIPMAVKAIVGFTLSDCVPMKYTGGHINETVFVAGGGLTWQERYGSPTDFGANQPEGAYIDEYGLMLVASADSQLGHIGYYIHGATYDGTGTSANSAVSAQELYRLMGNDMDYFGASRSRWHYRANNPNDAYYPLVPVGYNPLDTSYPYADMNVSYGIAIGFNGINVRGAKLLAYFARDGVVRAVLPHTVSFDRYDHGSWQSYAKFYCEPGTTTPSSVTSSAALLEPDANIVKWESDNRIGFHLLTDHLSGLRAENCTQHEDSAALLTRLMAEI